jgi:hypothetical protein
MVVAYDSTQAPLEDDVPGEPAVLSSFFKILITHAVARYRI